MSTAFVSGIAALILYHKPWLKNWQVMNIIRYTADDINNDSHPGKDIYIGYGRINLTKALVPITIFSKKKSPRAKKLFSSFNNYNKK